MKKLKNCRYLIFSFYCGIFFSCDHKQKDTPDTEQTIMFRPQAGRFIQAEIVPFSGFSSQFIYDSATGTLAGFRQTSYDKTGCNGLKLNEVVLSNTVKSNLEEFLSKLTIKISPKSKCESGIASDGDIITLFSFVDKDHLESNSSRVEEQYSCFSIQGGDFMATFQRAAEATNKLIPIQVSWGGQDYVFTACGK